LLDVVAIGVRLGLVKGQAGYAPKYDLNGSGSITLDDLLIAIAQYGRHCRQ
jgi:hypothetical protein